MKTKKIMVTGIAGMIGSHFLDELLERKYSVIGVDNLSFGNHDNIKHNLDNPDFKFYNVDVTDLETMKILGKDVDIIVHLAAFKKIGEKDLSMPTFKTNGKGTENIFEV